MGGSVQLRVGLGWIVNQRGDSENRTACGRVVCWGRNAWVDDFIYTSIT